MGNFVIATAKWWTTNFAAKEGHDPPNECKVLKMYEHRNIFNQKLSNFLLCPHLINIIPWFFNEGQKKIIS